MGNLINLCDGRTTIRGRGRFKGRRRMVWVESDVGGEGSGAESEEEENLQEEKGKNNPCTRILK